MASSFLLTLDTRAPVIAWGDVPASINAGDTVAIAFVSDEEIGHAWLDMGEDRIELAFTSESVDVAVPVDMLAGTATLLLADAAGNAASLDIEIISNVVEHVDTFPASFTIVAPAPPPPAPAPAPSIDGPFGPAIRYNEDRFPATFEIVGVNEDRFPARFEITDKEVVKAQFAVVRSNTDRIGAELLLSDRMLNLRREDEELLLLI